MPEAPFWRPAVVEHADFPQSASDGRTAASGQGAARLIRPPGAASGLEVRLERERYPGRRRNGVGDNERLTGPQTVSESPFRRHLLGGRHTCQVAARIVTNRPSRPLAPSATMASPLGGVVAPPSRRTSPDNVWMVNEVRVRRGLLFWGLVLVPLGAIPLLVRAGQLDPNRLVDAWRLWPLIVIGVGIVVLASRTRFAVVGTIVVALATGSIAGAAVASGNIWLGAVGACGFQGDGTAAADRSGSFTGPSALRLELDCGSLNLRAGGDAGWTFHGTYRGDPPTIDATANRLEVRTPRGPSHRQDWTIAVPASALQSLQLTANAGASTIDLGSAALDDLRADVNAGDIRVAASGAAVKTIAVTMNAGRLRLALASAATTGSVSVNAGAIDLCVPADVGLRFDVKDQLTFVTNLSSRGLSRDGSVWTRTASGGAGTIDLSVQGNAASFNLDPNGGC